MKLVGGLLLLCQPSVSRIMAVGTFRSFKAL